MKTLTVKLHENREALSVTMPGSTEASVLKTDELDDIMQILGRMRANMLPEFAAEDPKSDAKSSIVPAIRWYVDLDPDAPTQIRLYVLHMGFGWLWIPLGESNVDDMHSTMQRVLQSRPRLS